jgi:hypothetical protein
MSPRGVLVIGAAKRVLETALPAFAHAPQLYELRSVMAKHAREIEAGGRRYAVRAFDDFRSADLEGIELVYLAVSKPVVPRVLERLARCELGGIELLIDTPVLLPKHFRALRLIARFRSASVPEDCVHLPWLPLVQRTIGRGAIGALRQVEFDRSAYAYHAHATLKALAGAPLASARRTRGAGGSATRTLRFENGLTAVLREPRDYSVGRFRLIGERGCIADHDDGQPGTLRLQLLRSGPSCIGLQLGEETEPLDAAESELMGALPAGISVTAAHEAQKRVGFLRLLRALASGRAGYAVEDALEDTLSDYALEKLGRWRSTRFTSPRYAPARALLALASRIAGR